MTEQLFETEPDLTVAIGDDQAPRGLQFTEGDELVNAVQVDEFPIESRDAVSGLLWLGYLTEFAYLYGHVFFIRTLTRGEKLAVTQITKDWEQTLGMADAYETAMVAASLVEVDGTPLSMPLSANEDAMVRIRSNFRTVRDWYDPVVSELYRQIAMLEMKQRAAFDELQLK